MYNARRISILFVCNDGGYNDNAVDIPNKRALK